MSLCHNFTIKFLTSYRIKNTIQTRGQLATGAKIRDFEMWKNTERWVEKTHTVSVQHDAVYNVTVS
jgi:hypothetical protein